MPAIIAYTYEAAVHCPDCTRAAVGAARFLWADDPDAYSDKHGIPSNACDREGNEVRPVFSTDETRADLPVSGGGCTLSCDTCRSVLKQHFAAVGSTSETETP